MGHNLMGHNLTKLEKKTRKVGMNVQSLNTVRLFWKHQRAEIIVDFGPGCSKTAEIIPSKYR
jgi:hypothetical protein